MAAFFLFLLTALCVLEVMLFGLFGQALGPWAVLAEVLATGWLGLSLARGKIYLLEPEHLYTEEDPLFKKRLIAEKALLIVSGVLLLIPGLVTDALGVVLLSTEVRRVLAVALTAQSSLLLFCPSHGIRIINSGTICPVNFRSLRKPCRMSEGSPVIDGECRGGDTEGPDENKTKTQPKIKRRTRPCRASEVSTSGIPTERILRRHDGMRPFTP